MAEEILTEADSRMTGFAEVYAKVSGVERLHDGRKKPASCGGRICVVVVVVGERDRVLEVSASVQGVGGVQRGVTKGRECVDGY